MAGVLDRLAAMLSPATASDLADLDAEIARLQGVRDLVARALAAQPETGARVEPVRPKALPPKPSANGHAPGKPTPAARPTAPAPQGKRADAANERRLKVARLLSTGSFRSSEIGERLEIPQGSITSTLQHPWFEQEGKGKPYRLTEAGRLALAASAATATPATSTARGVSAGVVTTPPA